MMCQGWVTGTMCYPLTLYLDQSMSHSHAYGIDTHTLIMRLKEFGVERQVSCFLYLYHMET